MLTSGRRFWNNLGPALIAVIEMLIGFGRFGERNFVRDDKRRLGLSDGNEIAQCAIVRFLGWLGPCQRFVPSATGGPTRKQSGLVCLVCPWRLDPTAQTRRPLRFFRSAAPIVQLCSWSRSVLRYLGDRAPGTIEAHSEGEGKGAEFTIRLPLIAETGVQRGKTLLVVDDNPDHRALLAELLRRRGYEVIEAQDASEALQLISGQTPDACVIDMGLPGMNGFELARGFEAEHAFVCLDVARNHQDICGWLSPQPKIGDGCGCRCDQQHRG